MSSKSRPDYDCTKCEHFDGSYYCPGVDGAPCKPKCTDTQSVDLEKNNPNRCGICGSSNTRSGSSVGAACLDCGAREYVDVWESEG